MNKKDIIIISSLANAGLLIILLVTALISKDTYMGSSSLEVANSILEKDQEGMMIQELQKNILQENQEKIIVDFSIKIWYN